VGAPIYAGGVARTGQFFAGQRNGMVDLLSDIERKNFYFCSEAQQ
jgi:hypothetical protein